MPSRTPSIEPRRSQESEAAAMTRKTSMPVRRLPKEPPQRLMMLMTRPSGGRIARRAKTMPAMPMPLKTVPMKTVASCSR